MAAAAAQSKSSSSARRAVRPPTAAVPPVTPPAAPAAGRPRPALEPLALGRSSTERCIPVYTPRPGEEPAREHVPEADPAFRPTWTTEEVAEAERRAYLQGLTSARVREEVAAAWAATPVVLWGGLTLAGCVLHGALIAAALVLAFTALGAALPFVARRRWLHPGIVLGLLTAVGGGWLLHHVGGILTVTAGQVCGAAPAAGLQQVGSVVNGWLCLSVLALVGLLSAIVWCAG